MHKVGIVLARGGSKGIPRKNLKPFCGKPLVLWTVEQVIASGSVDSVWLSSDSEEILDTVAGLDCRTIRRPEAIAGDAATSESAWLHALEAIEGEGTPVDLVLAPQVTSPLREPGDFVKGFEDFTAQGCDSLFSGTVVEDLYFWKRAEDGTFDSVNYDYRSRSRRQNFPRQYVENGSFYIFSPGLLRRENNRLGGVIGFSEMDFWKMFEIDSLEHWKLCEALMRAYLLDGDHG